MDPQIISSVALGTLALIPIYVGSFSGLPHDEENESLSKEDAYWFPIIGSGALFSLYLIFTFLNKEYVNYLLTFYFAVVGVFSMTKLFTKFFSFLPAENVYQFVLSKRKMVIFDLNINWLNTTIFVISTILTGFYIYTKHWTLNNLLGLSFSSTGVSLLGLDNFATGFILLAGLFVYDIFWVFGTDVMVTVAKNFDAPIKLLFPRDIFAAEYEFGMLGLGDIVIPGIFIALCLKYDKHRSGVAEESTNFPKPYFYSCFAAYIIGLAITMVVMHTFKAAQPALLYLCPACMISVVLVALVHGDIAALFAFEVKAPEESGKKKNE